MLRKITSIIAILLPFLVFTTPVFAVSASSEITTFSNNTLQIITIIAGLASTLFLIKGGYQYMVSSGNVEAILNAKKTIKNAVIGLVLVLSANLIVSVFQGALNGTLSDTPNAAINIAPVTNITPSPGLAQVLLDALNGVFQNLVESATKPLLDSIMNFLASTPTVLNNSVIRNFWLVMVGICDTLFVIIVALLGLHVMSASVLGFEEVELRQLLPRLGLSFLGVNVSLFLADYAIITCNALTKAVVDSTGGLNHAWVENAINLQSIAQNNLPLITLLFLLIFLIVCIVLLFMYVSRLIIVALGAVLSPFIFLLWALPKFSDIADSAVRAYLVSVFTIFVHVVIIQLASAFLALPEANQSSLLSIAMAIGLFATLLKTPSLMMGLVMSASRNGSIKKMVTQITNIMTTDKSGSSTMRYLPKKARRKEVYA
jgi:hypothetical protein